MAAEIITSDDLREFKTDLLEEIKKLLKTSSTTGTKKYLKSSEMMKMLKISSGTLQTLRINGKLPYTKIGGIIFYDAEEIYKVMKDKSFKHNY